MTYPNEDVAELFEQSADRLVSRMAGLTDEEWSWQPIADDDEVTIRWRLDHIADAVGGQRNWTWLGAPVTDAPALSPAPSAQAGITTVEDGVNSFVALIRRPDVDLDELIGPIGGPYADVSRRGVVLHTLDELIHHAAEAALLRDLYAGQ